MIKIPINQKIIEELQKRKDFMFGTEGPKKMFQSGRTLFKIIRKIGKTQDQSTLYFNECNDGEKIAIYPGQSKRNQTRNKKEQILGRNLEHVEHIRTIQRNLALDSKYEPKTSKQKNDFAFAIALGEEKSFKYYSLEVPKSFSNLVEKSRHVFLSEDVRTLFGRPDRRVVRHFYFQ